MTVATGNFAALLWPGIRSIFGGTVRDWSKEYDKIFNVEPSNKAYEEYQEIAGIGLIPRKNEGVSISYNDPVQGYKTTITNLSYGGGIKITREMYDDDQYRKIRNMTRFLARSTQQTIETISALILDRAFNASYTGADGKVLCATDHPLPAGGTFSNRPTNHADLAETSLEQAFIDIAAFKSGDGLKMQAKPKMLIVSPNDDYMAFKLLRSPQEPESANNAVNPAKGRLPYMVSHFTTDTDAFFITTDVPDGLIFQWRTRPEFGKDNDSDRYVAKFKVYFRCEAGWANPRGVYGNAGA